MSAVAITKEVLDAIRIEYHLDQPLVVQYLLYLGRLDGTAQLWVREWDFETDTRDWKVIEDADERTIDESIRRQRGYDPDLWVVEVESREGRVLLGEEGL